MDIITYALCKNIASAAVSGISSIKSEGTSLIISTNSGQTIKIDFPKPKDGISISKVEVVNNQLQCTLSSGEIINAGTIKTLKGDKGDKGDRGEKGEKGEQGISGINGKDGKDGKDGINGKDGIDGKDGKDGVTPVKGTDYFTEDELKSIVDDIVEKYPDIGNTNNVTTDDIDNLFKDDSLEEDNEFVTTDDIDDLFKDDNS